MFDLPHITIATILVQIDILAGGISWSQVVVEATLVALIQIVIAIGIG